MPDSFQPYRLQHARLLCPPLTPGVCTNSHPLSWWSYLTISSSAVPFSFCLQSFPMSWLFASGGQSTGASASASVNEHSELISFRTDWFDRLDIQGTLKTLLQHHRLKASILFCLTFFMVQFSHPYITTGRTITLTEWTFVSKLMSL